MCSTLGYHPDPWCHLFGPATGFFWLIGYLNELCHGYENIRLHPLALICLFVLGLDEMVRLPGDEYTGVPDTTIEQVLFFDGNLLGLLDVNIIKSNKKKKRHTVNMGRSSCFSKMPFGLFPGLVKEDDRLCIFRGIQKVYVCRPIEESEDEDDGEHLIILGECYMNELFAFENNPTFHTDVDFILH
jgi:hypothetical protein